MRRSFTSAVLADLRNIPLQEVIDNLAICCKPDPTYRPLKDPSSRRWHVFTVSGDFEILTTQSKWYDTRAQKGGGGAIDLAMHLLHVPFGEAVQRLREHRKNAPRPWSHTRLA